MTFEEAKQLKEGDFVTCNTDNIYGVTDKDVPCSFIRIISTDTHVEETEDLSYNENGYGILVRVLDGYRCNSVYGVDYKYFDLVLNLKEISEDELQLLL